MKLLLLLCVCSLAVAAPGAPGASDTPLELPLALPGRDSGPPLRYCGRTLAKLLTLMCSNSEDNHLATSNDVREAPAATRRARRAARRARRDVVEHCCFSVCTLPDLLSYC